MALNQQEMTNIPKVSVILTSFNHDRFIAEAIESVLSQSFQDFELIIADDSSTDRSWEIISSYRDPRICLFKSDSNERGLINKVLKSGMVRGEYVAIHHSDDAWESDKLERQVEFLDRNCEVGAVFTKVKIIDEFSITIEDHQAVNNTQKNYLQIFDRRNRNKEEWLRRFFYKGNCLCHPSVLIRKKCYDIIGCYDVFYRQLPDFDFWVRVCQQFEIYILPEKLTKFRIHRTEVNTSATSDANLGRLGYEFYEILYNYISIKDKHCLLKIFPEENENIIIDGSLPEYCVAKAAINSENPSAKAFGTILLAELMRKEETREIISKVHNFNLNDFHKIIGSMDLFKTVTISTLEHKISELSKNIDAINEEKNLLVGNISTITQSTSWKITAPLRSLDNYFNNSRKKF